MKPTQNPYKKADGGGLNLLIQPNGSKLWRLSYRYGGKQKTLALGSYPRVSLAAARTLRQAAKDSLAAGYDPSAKVGKSTAAESSFQEVAQRWHDARRPKWSVGHASRVWSRVKSDLVETLGATPISEVSSSDMLNALRAIERRPGSPIETAHRVKGYAGEIFKFAKSEGLITHNPVLELQGALSSPPPVRHRASVSQADLPQLLSSIARYGGDVQTAMALKFVLQTFVRSSELRFSQWDEFEGLDGDEALWRIPAERMKMRRPHLVPLSKQALGTLKVLKYHAGGSDHVVPSRTRSGVISENTMIYALYRMGWSTRATVHGFRGTASTILNEKGFNRDWIERQLAHSDRDQVRAAYNSAEWLSDRRDMMNWWGAYLERLEIQGLAQA